MTQLRDQGPKVLQLREPWSGPRSLHWEQVSETRDNLECGTVEGNVGKALWK